MYAVAVSFAAPAALAVSVHMVPFGSMFSINDAPEVTAHWALLLARSTSRPPSATSQLMGETIPYLYSCEYSNLPFLSYQ